MDTTADRQRVPGTFRDHGITLIAAAHSSVDRNARGHSFNKTTLGLATKEWRDLRVHRGGVRPFPFTFPHAASRLAALYSTQRRAVKGAATAVHGTVYEALHHDSIFGGASSAAAPPAKATNRDCF